MIRRAVALAVVATVALAGCAGDDADDGGAGGDGGDGPSTTTTAPDAGGEPGVDLRELLLTDADLAGTGFETEVEARPFRADDAARILLCGEDLRDELEIESGRQSRFSDGTVELAHTVTLGGQASGLVDAFDAAVAGCDGPWTEPELPTGGGPIEREVTGGYPVPEVDLPATGAVVRSTNDRGVTDTVVVVVVAGPVVSSLSVSGPAGADFDVVDAAVTALAAKLA